VPVQHVIPGSHQDLYKWERKYLEFSEVDIKETQCGVIQRHGFGTCNSVFPGKEHELERGGLLFKIKQVAYRLGRNKEEPEVSDNLSAAAALFELRAGEELDTANDPVKTNASNYY